MALSLKQTRAARDSRAEIKLSNLLIITEGLGSTEEPRPPQRILKSIVEGASYPEF